MGKCTPGMPCYKGEEVYVYTTSNKCAAENSSDLYYSGANLPYTGIKTEDSLTVAIQKIDTTLNPTTLLASILEILETNPTLKAQLCEILSDCE